LQQWRAEIRLFRALRQLLSHELHKTVMALLPPAAITPARNGRRISKGI
jgi:hypothetical protein